MLLRTLCDSSAEATGLLRGEIFGFGDVQGFACVAPRGNSQLKSNACSACISNKTTSGKMFHFSNISEFQRAQLHVFFKEVVEMGHFGKTQGISNFRNRPGAVFQQNFCLL